MKSKWIEYQGKKILFADYSGFEEDIDRLQIEVDYITDILVHEPERSVLLLVDVSNTVATNKIVDRIKQSAFTVRPYVAKTAVVGVEGYRRIFLRAVSKFSGMELIPLNTLEAGKDWLIK